MVVCGDGIFTMNEPCEATRLPLRDDSSATFIPSSWYIHRDSRVSAIGDHYLLITRPVDTTIKTYYDRNVYNVHCNTSHRGLDIAAEFLSRHLIRLIAAGLTIIGQRTQERSVRFDAISSSEVNRSAFRHCFTVRMDSHCSRASSDQGYALSGAKVNPSRDPT